LDGGIEAEALQMTTPDKIFSVRDFLRKRKALLVHFSTVMSGHQDLYFPHDLRTAATLTGPLSFSTIHASDVGPFQTSAHPSLANAAGSVGIVVDITDDNSVVTVGHDDDGTFFDPIANEWHSGGRPPSADACARSIDKRRTTNEWFVKNYTLLASLYSVQFSCDSPSSWPGKRHTGKRQLSSRRSSRVFRNDASSQ
jgi:hypothetical protein